MPVTNACISAGFKSGEAMRYMKGIINLYRPVVAALLLLVLVACGSSKDDQNMVQVAKEYSAQNKMREAALELKNALQINPENAEARYMLGQINLDFGETASAEKEFTRAASFGWSEEAVMIGLARAIIISNEYSRMSDEVSIKSAYSPSARASLHGLRSIAYTGNGELEQAQEELAAGMEIDGAVLINEQGLMVHSGKKINADENKIFKEYSK